MQYNCQPWANITNKGNNQFNSIIREVAKAFNEKYQNAQHIISLCRIMLIIIGVCPDITSTRVPKLNKIEVLVLDLSSDGHTYREIDKQTDIQTYK